MREVKEAMGLNWHGRSLRRTINGVVCECAMEFAESWIFSGGRSGLRRRPNSDGVLEAVSNK